MTYEELVEKFAASRVYPLPVERTDEMIAAFKKVEDNDKFRRDVQKKCAELEEKRKNHKENNTPEYQQALKRYNELIDKYVVLSYQRGFLFGIDVADVRTLNELFEYGIDNNIDNFMKEVEGRSRLDDEYVSEEIRKAREAYQKKRTSEIPEDGSKMKM